jgi:hypothetical protein
MDAAGLKCLSVPWLSLNLSFLPSLNREAEARLWSFQSELSDDEEKWDEDMHDDVCPAVEEVGADEETDFVGDSATASAGLVLAIGTASAVTAAVAKSRKRNSSQSSSSSSSSSSSRRAHGKPASSSSRKPISSASQPASASSSKPTSFSSKSAAKPPSKKSSTNSTRRKASGRKSASDGRSVICPAVNPSDDHVLRNVKKTGSTTSPGRKGTIVSAMQQVADTLSEQRNAPAAVNHGAVHITAMMELQKSFMDQAGQQHNMMMSIISRLLPGALPSSYAAPPASPVPFLPAPAPMAIHPAPVPAAIHPAPAPMVIRPPVFSPAPMEIRSAPAPMVSCAPVSPAPMAIRPVASVQFLPPVPVFHQTAPAVFRPQPVASPMAPAVPHSPSPATGPGL